MAREFIARKGLIVSGSTLISGSIIATSFTGSLLGTSSYATTALSASYAPGSTAFPFTGSAIIKGSGTTSSTTSLRVENSSNTARLTILDNGTSAFNTSHLYISSSGNIGIGTASPVGLLNLYGGAGNNPAILTLQSVTGGGGNTGIYFRPYQNESFANTATAQATILAEDTNYSAHIKFSTKVPGASGNALTERMRITGVGSIGIGTTTPSASLHVSGSTIISSSLVVGSGSLGPNENTLTLGARDTTNEGGQLGLNAPGGTYISASFIDLYQNKLRILKGTNAGSTGEVAWWSMHNLQMALPGYNSVSAFPGTAVAVLSVDTSGNVLTSSPVISFNSQGGSYTLASTDADKLIEMNSAAPNTLTVPTNASVPIAVGTQFMVVQQNTGPTNIAAAGGVTLNSAGGLLNLASQYSSATLVKRAVDEWYVFGDLA
jgi:hypothetical protein